MISSSFFQQPSISPTPDFSRTYPSTSIGTPLITTFRRLRQATAPNTTILLRRVIAYTTILLFRRGFGITISLFRLGLYAPDVLEVLKVQITLDRGYLGGSVVCRGMDLSLFHSLL